MMNGLTKHSEILHKNVSKNLKELSQDTITNISKYTEMQIGNLYIIKNESICLKASYGTIFDDSIVFQIGEGIVGESAANKSTILTKINHPTLNINTGLGSTDYLNLLIVPLIANEQVIGILEFCSITPISTLKVKLIETLSENIAYSINTY